MFEIGERLLEKSVLSGRMVESATGLCISHGMDEKDARTDLLPPFRNYLRDQNVSSLLPWGAILQEDKLYWRGKHSEIKDDPPFIVADEIIWMAIAVCTGGTCAKFEFARNDQKKPGTPASPGPFPDDAVASLIAGCTSRLYTECCECS